MTEDRGDLSFVADIQEMMFGLGDCARPLEATAKVIEEVVLTVLNSFVCQAEEISSRRSSRVICPQDFLFLMRKDPVKLQRLINYLTLKDQKSVFQNGLSFSSCGEVDVDGSSYTVPTHSNRSQICVAYLKDLGIDISMDPSKQVFDPIKMKRQMRAERMSRNLTPSQYEQFAKARQSSFYNKFKKSQKFLEWLSAKHGENVVPKLKASTYDILLYVAKETVAQILDLAFLLREDRLANPCNPYSRAEIASAQSVLRKETYGTSSGLENNPPVKPEEIREVVRKYWSSQLCPFTLFSRTLIQNSRNRLMISY